MKRIQFSERALNDLQEIKRYTIDCWSKEQYVAYRDELINAIYALPDKSILISFSQYRSYSYIHCLRHYIFFRLTGNEVYIIRILPERQRFAKHLVP